MRLALLFVFLGALCAWGCKSGDAADDASPAPDASGPDDAAGSDTPDGVDEDHADLAADPSQEAPADPAGDPAMADSAPKEDAAADAAYEFGLPPTGVPAFDLDGCWWYVQCIHDCAPGDAACRTACAAGLSDVVSGVAPGVAECVDQEGCWNADGTLDLICLYATCKDSYLDCYVETPEGSCRGNFICLAHCTWDEATEGREWVQCVDENCLLDDGPAGSEAAFNMMACVNHECPGCLFDDPPPGCGVCAVEARCGACKDETDLCFGHRGFRGCVWSYQCTARCASENQPDTCSFDCDSMTSIEADCAVRRLRACILEACKANPECGKDYWCPCAQAAMKGECKQFWDACLAVPDAQ